MTQPFWIDTDTASDDAVALIMALRHPDIDVVGISVVAGNVPLDQAVQNALFTRELCERDDVAIFSGADRPRSIALETAQNVHGADGMGDIGIDLTGRSPDGDDAIDRLLDASHTHAGVLTLVTLGPLTNIAAALDRDPSLTERIERTVVMGAVGDHIGNVTPVAEYNMWADPDAAQAVFAAGLDVEIVGWDVSRRFAVIEPDLAAELRSVGTPLAEFAIDIQGSVTEFCADETGLAGFDLPDPIAMAVAIDPSIATKVERFYVDVETRASLTRGMVVIDVLELLHRPANASVVREADRDGFVAMLRAALS